MCARSCASSQTSFIAMHKTHSEQINQTARADIWSDATMSGGGGGVPGLCAAAVAGCAYDIVIYGWSRSCLASMRETIYITHSMHEPAAASNVCGYLVRMEGGRRGFMSSGNVGATRSNTNRRQLSTRFSTKQIGCNTGQHPDQHRSRRRQLADVGRQPARSGRNGQHGGLLSDVHPSRRSGQQLAELGAHVLSARHARQSGAAHAPGRGESEVGVWQGRTGCEGTLDLWLFSLSVCVESTRLPTEGTCPHRPAARSRTIVCSSPSPCW